MGLGQRRQGAQQRRKQHLGGRAQEAINSIGGHKHQVLKYFLCHVSSIEILLQLVILHTWLSTTTKTTSLSYKRRERCCSKRKQQQLTVTKRSEPSSCVIAGASPRRCSHQPRALPPLLRSGSSCSRNRTTTTERRMKSKPDRQQVAVHMDRSRPAVSSGLSCGRQVEAQRRNANNSSSPTGVKRRSHFMIQRAIQAPAQNCEHNESHFALRCHQYGSHGLCKDARGCMLHMKCSS